MICGYPGTDPSDSDLDLVPRHWPTSTWNPCHFDLDLWFRTVISVIIDAGYILDTFKWSYLTEIWTDPTPFQWCRDRFRYSSHSWCFGGSSRICWSFESYFPAGFQSGHCFNDQLLTLLAETSCYCIARISEIRQQLQASITSKRGV